MAANPVQTFGSLFQPDQPYSTDLGRQQEEDLHQEATFHVCLRTVGHRLPTHTAAAGDYCGTPHHRATAGARLFDAERARLDFLMQLQLVSFPGDLRLPEYPGGPLDLQSDHSGGGGASGLQWPAYP